jgi:hypothetical protein
MQIGHSMARDKINIRVEVDRETDLNLRRWCKTEGRSKRTHCSVVLRKISKVFIENGQALKQLGIN